jgi:hypothetical protein
MSSALTWLAAFALIAVFTWAAVAKLVRYTAWNRALAAYGFDGGTRQLAAPLVPAAEIATAAVLAFAAVRVGAALSLALLGGFSLAVLRARARRGNRLPCGCFGRTKARDYRLMLLRNGLLAALAAVVLLSSETEGLLSGMEVPPAGEILPAMLAAIGVGIAGAVLWQANRALSSATRAPRGSGELSSSADRKEQSI